MAEHTPFDLPERFWAKTRPTEDGCLIWTASKQSSGYGCFGWLGTTQLAHRVSYQAAKGDIPDGWHVDHLCRVRLCVNPEHLEAVTPAENNRRMLDALTAAAPVGRCYPTVTHHYRERSGFEGSAEHVNLPYMRRRCPRCADTAADVPLNYCLGLVHGLIMARPVYTPQGFRRLRRLLHVEQRRAYRLRLCSFHAG